jgi:site-specific DNA recombinase
MKNVILYIRVSTDEQAEKGYSLNAQLELLTKFCVLKGWDILKIFKEDFSAWKGFERPEYRQLKEYLKLNRKKVDYLLFTQWSRFSRDYTSANLELKNLRERGVEPNAVEQWVDFSVPENLYLLAFYLTAPQVENDRLSLRTRAGMRQAVKQGRWLWQAPLGYFNDRVNKVILPDEKQALLVKFAFETFAKGIYSIQEVRNMAEEKGLKLSKQGFIDLLRNPLYMGKILLKRHKEEPDQLIDGIHEPLISEELFDEAQRILKGKKKPYTGVS